MKAKREGGGSRWGFTGVLLVAVVAVIGILALSTISDVPGDIFGDVLALLGISEDETQPYTYVNSVRTMLQVNVAQFDRMIVREAEKDYFSPLLPDVEVKVAFQGTAFAGIDLDLLTEEDFAFDGDESVTIALPYPYITRCDVSKADTLSSQCGASLDCAKELSELHDLAQKKAITKLRTLAEEEAFLDYAYDAAQEKIAEFFYSRGFASVVFIEPEEKVFQADVSCYPMQG